MHRFGNEAAWWANLQIIPLPAANRAAIGFKVTMPAELRSLSEPLPLPGGGLRDFEIMIIDGVRPEPSSSGFGRLILSNLSWGILGVDAYRASTIESLLVPVDGEGLPDDSAPMVQAHRIALLREISGGREFASRIR